MSMKNIVGIHQENAPSYQKRKAEKVLFIAKLLEAKKIKKGFVYRRFGNCLKLVAV